MDLLIFDMDGVLVKPWGYHRALQETVRMAGIATGFGEVQLVDEQITVFEALGISSEWHSSALCMAFMVVAQNAGMVIGEDHSQPGILNLEELFEAIAIEPMQDSALLRGLAAIEGLAERHDVPVELVSDLMAESESIQYSPTLNWFQELILGSENYERIYQKKPQFQIESYLQQYDERLLNETQAEKVVRWADRSGHGAAIMTNRPSIGPSGFAGMPDSEMGSDLVGLAALPLVGKGEILWLAAHTDRPVEHFSKPTWKHAMAAILVASGWPVEKSLKFVGEQPADWNTSDLQFLNPSRVMVFEDTPGGLVAAGEAGELLNGIGLQVEVQKIGVAKKEAKQSALSAHGASVYADINQALASLDDF
jgi:phosphoglycolate phosphatase-like HAD superfamily hydrolase